MGFVAVLQRRREQNRRYAPELVVRSRSLRKPGERMSVEARLCRIAQRHGEVLTVERRDGR